MNMQPSEQKIDKYDKLGNYLLVKQSVLKSSIEANTLFIQWAKDQAIRDKQRRDSNEERMEQSDEDQSSKGP